MVVDAANPVYDSREDCNAIIHTSTNELIAGCKNSQIPNSVTSLGNDCAKGAEVTARKDSRLYETDTLQRTHNLRIVCPSHDGKAKEIKKEVLCLPIVQHGARPFPLT